MNDKIAWIICGIISAIIVGMTLHYDELMITYYAALGICSAVTCFSISFMYIYRKYIKE